MEDGLIPLQEQTTQTASFNSTGVRLVTGTPIAGLVARIIYRAAGNTSGDNTATFSIEESADDVTYYARAGAPPLALSSTPQGGEILLPFFTDLAYVRLALVIAGAGTLPTITYRARLRVA